MFRFSRLLPCNSTFLRANLWIEITWNPKYFLWWLYCYALRSDYIKSVEHASPQGHVQKTPLLLPLLIQINPGRILSSVSVSSKCCLPFACESLTILYAYFIFHACYMHHSSHPPDLITLLTSDEQCKFACHWSAGLKHSPNSFIVGSNLIRDMLMSFVCVLCR
jgi:hypothetical protein